MLYDRVVHVHALLSANILLFVPSSYIGIVEDPTRFGYGCDGFDSNCDIDRLIDECAEDKYPPNIDLSAANSCKDVTFASADDAKGCVVERAIAMDDCLPVMLTTTLVAETSCSTGVEVTATAIGCNSRAVEDISTAMVSGLKVDSTPPEVTCDLGTQGALISFHFLVSQLSC